MQPMNMWVNNVIPNSKDISKDSMSLETNDLLNLYFRRTFPRTLCLWSGFPLKSTIMDIHMDIVSMMKNNHGQTHGQSVYA